MANASLIKLLIEGYKDAACSKFLTGSIKAVINPENYARNFNVRYEPSKEKGANAKTQIFTSMESSGFELDLIVDGTGVIPLDRGMTVDSYIEKFKSIVYNYQGSEHRPNYLKITWGKVIFTGVCEKLNIRYTLFSPDGTPLRASIKITLLETVDFHTKIREAQKSSPDLTHIRTVNAGDSLPLLSYQIYGDSSYYMEVARANGLSSFQAIKPGDQIYFPPLKK